MTRASFFSWAEWFESYLVENSEDRFSRDKAQIKQFCSFHGTQTSFRWWENCNCFKLVTYFIRMKWANENEMSHIMRLWHFSSSINSFFKRACTAIQWCLIFGWTLRLLTYLMCANSEGSSETVQMCRLVWAFTGHLCDKCHNLMSWLK